VKDNKCEEIKKELEKIKKEQGNRIDAVEKRAEKFDKKIKEIYDLINHLGYDLSHLEDGLDTKIEKVDREVEGAKNIRDRLLSDSIQVFTVFMGFLSLFITIFVVSIEKIDTTFLKKFSIAIVAYFTLLMSVWFILWIKREHNK